MTEPRHNKPPVVLLAYHYPPSAEVGAVRAARVAQALADAGHQVTVIRAASRDAEPTVPCKGITVRTIVPGRSPRQWYSSARRALQRLTASSDRDPVPHIGAPNRSPAPWRPPERVSALKRWIFSLLWLPDDCQGFIWRAATATATALEVAGPGAILYTTSPPHSAQLAGLLAQLWTGAVWVAEFRDPWTDNPVKPWYCRTELTDRLERWAEQQCLRRARLIVGASEGICDLLRDRAAAVGGGEVVLVRNGIDRIEQWRVRPQAQRPIRVLHAGTCYLGRDPRPFLAALATVARRRNLGPAELAVEFLGRCEWFNGVSLQGVAADLGLEQLVRFTPWLPPDQARQRMQEADVLLLLAEGQPLQVPQKLYEYMGAGRRMLVFADQRGETARMVQAVGGHVITQARAPNLEAQVERALLAPPDVAPDAAILAEWSTQRQMAKLVAALAWVATIRPNVELSARLHRSPDTMPPSRQD